MKFDMKKEHNCASFYDKDNKILVVIDSFDNETFYVRTGSLSQTSNEKEITAIDDAELNQKIEKIYADYRECKEKTVKV